MKTAATTRFRFIPVLTAPWQVEIFMDEGSVHENDARSDSTLWMVWASPMEPMRTNAPRPVSIPVLFGAS
jgi:hypothetical protein